MYKHGNELAKIAEKNSVNLLFEASVGGGIPIIKSIKEIWMFIVHIVETKHFMKKIV